MPLWTSAESGSKEHSQNKRKGKRCCHNGNSLFNNRTWRSRITQQIPILKNGGSNPFVRAKKSKSSDLDFSFMSAGHNFITSEASTSFDSLLSTSLSEKRTQMNEVALRANELTKPSALQIDSMCDIINSTKKNGSVKLK